MNEYVNRSRQPVSDVMQLVNSEFEDLSGHRLLGRILTLVRALVTGIVDFTAYDGVV